MSIIDLTDSYKFSHFNQYPKKTEFIHSYMCSRGGEYQEMIFFGLTYYIKKYIEGIFIGLDICQTEKLTTEHGLPFYKDGWEYILKTYNGKLPIIIKALPEGVLFKSFEPIMTIENTDPKCAWLVGHLETLLLKIWYPTTIATKSHHIKRMLKSHWNKTSDNPDGIDFAFHNFGDRGSSSVESAAIGGIAHLTQFKGTDNFNAVDLQKKYYNNKYMGYSIPATEHSTVTSWGKDGEFKMIENYLETYKSNPIIACVLDSYDIYKAVDFVTSGIMKKKIESDDYPVFVIRPDSGEPIEVITKILSIMRKNNVIYTVNSKGYIIFNKYRIIWGDGVTPLQINAILEEFCTNQNISSFETVPTYSAENFAFGSGGDIMQNINRDTCKFAIKASAIKVDGKWEDIYKDPITDKGKKSLKGKQDNLRFITYYG